MIKWVIPDTNRHRSLNFWMIDYMKRRKELFRPNAKIFAAYGVLHDTILSGGRITNNENIGTEHDMRLILERYKASDVEYRLVLTQRAIKDEMLFDHWANLQLKLVEEYEGGVILASDKLLKYVQEHYPKLKIISSTTKLTNEETFIKEFETNNYDTVVLSTVYNFNYDFIPLEYRPHTEILINDCCPPLCVSRAQCYAVSAATNLGIDCDTSCKNPAKHAASERIENNPDNFEAILQIKEFLCHYYYPQIDIAHNDGFEQFKFTGREDSVIHVATQYAYYMGNEKDFFHIIFECILSLKMLREEFIKYH